MTVLWSIIGVLLVIVWAITLVDIFRRHIGGKQTVAWLLIVLIVPFLGAILYWALRRPTEEERRRALDNATAMEHGGQRAPFDSTHVGR